MKKCLSKECNFRLSARFGAVLKTLVCWSEFERPEEIAKANIHSNVQLRARTVQSDDSFDSALLEEERRAGNETHVERTPRV